MPVTAFEGPAGSGKTTRLIGHLGQELAPQRHEPHARVLALTFMHGARRRLESRLRAVPALGRRYLATTVDSFAWRLIRRWRQLAADLGHALPEEEDYENTCALAAALLARPIVRSWLALSYPVIVVDEAQDLSAARSAMISEAAGDCHVLLAFDEFQCLSPALRPMPIAGWLAQVCTPVSLEGCQRTNDAELLAAAGAMRAGHAVRRDGKRFKVALTPSPKLAAAYLANFMAWRKGGNVAVLTPSRSKGFADEIVSLVCDGPVGSKKNGPFGIVWESTDDDERSKVWDRLTFPTCCSVPQALAALEPHHATPAVKTARAWIARQARVTGLGEVTAVQVRRQIDRAYSVRRWFGRGEGSEYSAMTIHQAKNREFDHVAVIWPYTIPNNDDQKRRLLYNAITRAKRSCLVLVQAQELLDAPPFVPRGQ
jgi:hypothetical protein